MKYKVLLLLLVVTIILCACAPREGTNMVGTFKDKDTRIADGQMDALLSAIQAHDTEKLIMLFSRNALQQIADIDAMISKLFAYCPDEFASYNNWGGPDTETSWDYGQKVSYLYATYDVEATGGKYRFAFMYAATDTACPENVGFWSVYVIAWDEDTDTQFAYRGDNLYTPGIHIGVKNALPEENP